LNLPGQKERTTNLRSEEFEELREAAADTEGEE
jgi:hypothetical protein